MTVNVSTRQLATPSLVGTIRAALTEAGIEPGRLHLEITETALILDDDRSIKTLQSLRDMGVRLAIDDFGTGYSSLTYLKQLPIDVLKIDRSFVDGLGTDPNDTSIVRMILSLASALDLTAIAEGVETEVQLAALQRVRLRARAGLPLEPRAAAGRARRVARSHVGLRPQPMMGG